MRKKSIPVTVRGGNGNGAGDEDEEKARLLAAVTQERPSDPTDLPEIAMVREFADPSEWRTMGFVDPHVAFYASMVMARSRRPDSVRARLVRELYLQSRSVEGKGSIQTKEVSVKSHEPKPGFWERALSNGARQEPSPDAVVGK